VRPGERKGGGSRQMEAEEMDGKAHPDRRADMESA
jgi:hypothetical protein